MLHQREPPSPHIPFHPRPLGLVPLQGRSLRAGGEPVRVGLLDLQNTEGEGVLLGTTLNLQ